MKSILIKLASWYLNKHKTLNIDLNYTIYFKGSYMKVKAITHTQSLRDADSIHIEGESLTYDLFNNLANDVLGNKTPNELYEAIINYKK